MKILYISYDGMLEPLGQSQVLAYLKCLSVSFRIHLLSFEKTEDWMNSKERERIRREIDEAGIIWHILRYHKRPSALATSWDITCGIFVGLWLVIRHGITIVHARSYVPSVMALALKRFTGIKYVFDMRGFWADERVDAGLWSRDGLMFRMAKSFEKRFLLAADHVVSLTHAAVREIRAFDYLQSRCPPITVIPTCADLGRFKPLQRDDVGRGFVIGYVGAVGLYYLFDKVAECFSKLLELRPDAKLLILNRGQHTYIKERLSLAGVPESAVEIMAVYHPQVPQQMARMDAGIFFIKPVFSKKASAPTKLGEFLGCGIPCLGNAGVGDMAEVLEQEQVGVAITSFEEPNLIEALDKLLHLVSDQNTKQRCVNAAQKYFSLDNGVLLHLDIYKKLLKFNDV